MVLLTGPIPFAYIMTFFFFNQRENIVTRTVGREFTLSIRFNVLMAAGIVCSAVVLIYPAFFKKKSGKTDAKKEA